jgi:hypothetical protein
MIGEPARSLIGIEEDGNGLIGPGLVRIGFDHLAQDRRRQKQDGQGKETGDETTHGVGSSAQRKSSEHGRRAKTEEFFFVTGYILKSPYENVKTRAVVLYIPSSIRCEADILRKTTDG